MKTVLATILVCTTALGQIPPMPKTSIKLMSPKHTEFTLSLGTPKALVPLVLVFPTNDPPMPLTYYIGGRASGVLDVIPWIYSPTNTGLTNAINFKSNYVGEFNIIWTPQALPPPYTCVGIQISFGDENWVYYPDMTNYFKVYPDEFGNLGLAFGSDDDVTDKFFRGIPE